MSAKNRDEHDRFRNITVGFRVSPEENKQINEVVAVSGLPKQEYCYRRCMSREITVLPNTRVFKGLKDTMNSLTSELQRISSVSEITDENFDTLRLIISALNGLKGETNGE